MKISLWRRNALVAADAAFSHKIYYVTIFSGDSKFQRASKLHCWFKSYGDLAEWVDFAHWWSFIGKGLRLQPAQQSCFLPKGMDIKDLIEIVILRYDH